MEVMMHTCVYTLCLWFIVMPIFVCASIWPYAHLYSMRNLPTVFDLMLSKNLQTESFFFQILADLVALTSRGFPSFNFTREILTFLHSLHFDSSIVRGCKVAVWETDIYIVKRSFAIICKHFKNLQRRRLVLLSISKNTSILGSNTQQCNRPLQLPLTSGQGPSRMVLLPLLKHILLHLFSVWRLYH